MLCVLLSHIHSTLIFMNIVIVAVVVDAVTCLCCRMLLFGLLLCALSIILHIALLFTFRAIVQAANFSGLQPKVTITID